MWQVLIADDVKMNRKLLRAALSRHCCSEWEIAECASAEAAVAEMSSTSDSRYDLVLMDDHFEVNDAHDSACLHAQHRPSAHSPQIPCAPSLSQSRTSQPPEYVSTLQVDGSVAKPSNAPATGACEHGASLVALRGSEALAYIRDFERQNPSVRPAVLIMCTGASLEAGAPWRKHADAVWGKPFPDFTNNTMQRMLSELLRKRPDVTAPSGAGSTRASPTFKITSTTI